MRIALLFWLSKMATQTDIITRGKSFDETGVKMVGGGNGQKERLTMKTLVSLLEKHEIMCCDPVFFCPFLK